MTHFLFAELLILNQMGWAVLCSRKGNSTLLVFRSDTDGVPYESDFLERFGLRTRRRSSGTNRIPGARSPRQWTIRGLKMRFSKKHLWFGISMGESG